MAQNYPPYQQPPIDRQTGLFTKPWQLFFLGLTGGAGGLDGGTLTPGTVPLDALQTIDSPRLLGRGTAGVGPVEELFIGNGLALTDLTLSVTSDGIEQLGYWTPITNGDPLSPEILFDAEGDCVVGFVPTTPGMSSGGGGGSSSMPAHAWTHQAGESDALAVTTLAGYPGGTTTFLRGDGTFATPLTPGHGGTLGIVFDGGGSVIVPGIKGFFEVGVACRITAATLLSTDAATTAGSIVVDLWKTPYGSYPPTVGNSITASAKPTLSSASQSRDTTLTGWTTLIQAGDILAFVVDSATTVTKVNLTLTVQL